MELNTLFLIIVGVLLLWLALNNKLKNVSPAIQVLLGP